MKIPVLVAALAAAILVAASILIAKAAARGALSPPERIAAVA